VLINLHNLEFDLAAGRIDQNLKWQIDNVILKIFWLSCLSDQFKIVNANSG
jgi:hypothetical protein